MSAPSPVSHPDIAVVGTGLAGIVTALALVRSGAHVASIGPAPGAAGRETDHRTTALLTDSVRLLRNLGVWDICAPHAAPLEAIRIIDDTGRLLRAPSVEFTAREIGIESFGFNVPNTPLLDALWRRAQDFQKLGLVDAQATEVETAGGAAAIRLSGGQTLRSLLVVGADGRQSLCRAAAGIETTSWRYDQMAIACNFMHTEPHANFCTELHRSSGPFTVVPLPGRASSLVWVERPSEAAHLLRLDDEAFARQIEQRLQGLLGTVAGVGPRAAFPLSGLTARAFARRRIALVGEAAHVIPPIGAQGLNLAFRDAAALADCVVEAFGASRDPGGDESLAAYDRARQADVLTRTAAVDILNRSLLSGFVPVQALRGLALHALGAFAPLRRFVMRQGVAPTGSPPSLMR